MRAFLHRTKDFIWDILPTLREWAAAYTIRVDELGVRLFAAAIAYRTIFSLVSFMSAFFIFTNLLDLNMGHVGDDSLSIDEKLAEFAKGMNIDTSTLSTEGAAAFAVISLIFGLWGLTGGFSAICDVLDRVHNTQRYVRMSKRYLRGGVVAFFFLLFISLALAIINLVTGAGGKIFSDIGLTLVSNMWVVVTGSILAFVFVIIAFGVIFRIGSHARPAWREVIVGSIFAAIAWSLLLVGFYFFLRFFDPYENYGVLAGAVAILIFGYLQAWIMIVTAMYTAPVIEFVRESTTALENNRFLKWLR